MSARLTYSLSSDENQSLHKQIGCMNGIFHIFDRRYFLGSRSMAGRNRKKLLPPPGHNDGTPMEPNTASQRTPGKKQKKTAKEKQRVSTESSRTSFSSTTSCSSSFSSLDATNNNRAAHLETTLPSHVDFPGNATREFLKNQHNAAAKQFSRQSFEFRDIVKENMNREACGMISVRTVAGEEAVIRKLRHVDSPRPMRSVESHDSKNLGSNESFRVLARFREAHRNANEENDIPTHSAPKFNRRLSYDGRESSYDTLKSTIKIRELPRLSLDSKESWAKRSAPGMRSNDLVKDLQKGDRDSEEPVSSRQSSTIVAKLMGLEALPDSISTTNSPSRLINVCPTYEQNSLSRSSRKNDENTQQSRFSGSPRISHGDFYSPSLRNNHLGLKPNACTKLKVEITQKSQLNRIGYLNEPATESHELATDVPNSFSVYGEIEKRLSTLEFTKSGKDLRALKQILETMQKSRAMLENKEQASDCASQISTDGGTVDQNRSSGAASPRNSQLDNTASSARAKVSNSSKSYKSSIIIMKPAKHLGKISNPSPSLPLNRDASGDHCTSSGNEQVKMQSTRDIGPQHTHLRSLPSHSQPIITDKNSNTRISKSTKSMKDQHCQTEISTTSGSSPRVTSSRLHKKFGLEKKSCPTTPSSDSSRTERINSRKVGSCSTEIKHGQKSPTSNQKSTKRSSKSSICPGDMNQRGGGYPLKPESNGVASNINTKNTSNKQFDNNRSNYVLQDDDGCEQRNTEMRLSNNVTEVKPTLTIPEQQSPVSVLDSTFYQDDSPSPIKKISFAFEDGETINSEAESSQDVPIQSKSAETLSTEIKNLKSEINNLRKHIRQVNFSNEEEEEELLNDCQNHLCQEMSSQHKYIWQILSESGFLKDLGHGLSAIQLHSPGHLINPNLFLALEQSKAVKWPFNGDSYSQQNSRSEARNKVQRKLVFDTVNEILLDKLAIERSSKHWLSISNIAGTESRGQQILEELCTHIDQLQDSNQNGSLDDYDDASRNMILEDLMHPSRYWGDYQNNVPGIVLDVERLIFKDLITEIVMNEASVDDDHCSKFPSN